MTMTIASGASVLIICPIFLEASRISRLIQCLRSQTHELWTLFVHDNCSNDGTEEILRRLSKVDQRIHFKIAGRSEAFSKNWESAINEGLALGEFDYVMIIAGDDYLEPNSALEELIQGLLQSKKKIIVPKFIGRDHLSMMPDKLILDLTTLSMGEQSRVKIMRSWAIGHLVYAMYEAQIFRDVFGLPKKPFASGTDSDWFRAAEIIMKHGPAIGKESKVVYVKDQRPEDIFSWKTRQSGKSARSKKVLGDGARTALYISDIFWPISAGIRIHKSSISSKGKLFVTFRVLPYLQLLLLRKTIRNIVVVLFKNRNK